MAQQPLRGTIALLLIASFVSAHALYPIRTAHADDTAPPTESASEEPAPAPAVEEPTDDSDEEQPVDDAESEAPIEGAEEPAPSEDEAGAQDPAGDPVNEPSGEGTVEEETVEDASATDPIEATEAPAVEGSEENIEADTSAATTTLELLSAAASTTPDVATTTATTTEALPPEIATSTAQGPVIVSGEAIALANILNLVNTNFVNSEGIMLFSNFFELVSGAIDFRDSMNPLFMGSCESGPCTGGEEVSVNVSNNATIENYISIIARSGGNAIEGGGDAAIDTGNAYAGLNLINVANSNFVDSEYLLVTMNAFNGVDGDIVFPSLSDFFSSLADGASSPSTIELVNDGEVVTDADIGAESGGNTVTDTASSTITTGDAYGSGNVFNQLNTSLVGGQNVSIVFRVHGDWAGEVFGAPPGLAWTRGEDGSIYLFDTAAGAASGATNGTSVSGTSTALITNDVSVIALTGENAIDGANTALVATGDAYAGANIVNVANTNVVGRNWILAVINIFGDFNGNIAFGRPDLWVGEQIDVPSRVENDSILTYTFSVINNGDSEATDVRLVDDFDAERLEIVDSSLAYELDDEGHIVWDLTTIPAGAGTEIEYRARVVNADPGDEIANVVTVASRETDDNLEDNTDTASVEVYRPSSSRSERIERVPAPIVLDVLRTSPFRHALTAGETVRQSLVVRNDTKRDAHEIALYDILAAPDGTILKEEVWELGTVHAGEEVTLGYDVQFSTDAPAGTYTLTTALVSRGAARIESGVNGVIELTAAPEPIEVTSEPVATSTVGASTDEERSPRVAGIAKTAFAAGALPVDAGASDLFEYLLYALVGICALGAATLRFRFG